MNKKNSTSENWLFVIGALQNGSQPDVAVSRNMFTCDFALWVAGQPVCDGFLTNNWQYKDTVMLNVFEAELRQCEPRQK